MQSAKAGVGSTPTWSTKCQARTGSSPVDGIRALSSVEERMSHKHRVAGS